MDTEGTDCDNTKPTVVTPIQDRNHCQLLQDKEDDPELLSENAVVQHIIRTGKPGRTSSATKNHPVP